MTDSYFRDPSAAPIADAYRTEDERPAAARIEQAVADAVALKRWWNGLDPQRDLAERFELAPAQPGVAPTWGFFASVPVGGRDVAMMGVTQEFTFDRLKVPRQDLKQATHWLVGQAREFFLRYYLRSYTATPPQAYPEIGHRPVPELLRGFSLFPGGGVRVDGSAPRQVLYKTLQGSVGEFPAGERSRIVDLRTLGTEYRWVAIQMNLFDFDLTLARAGSGLPSLVVPLGQQVHIVLSSELIEDTDQPRDGVLASFGPGMAFVKQPGQHALAYGPTELEPAVQLERFEVLESGEIRARLVFILNRPEQLVNLSLVPVDLAVALTNRLTFGASRRWLGAAKRAIRYGPSIGRGLDPVLSAIRLGNALTGDRLADDFSISKEAIEKTVLLEHARVVLDTVARSQQTWSRVTDWTDAAAIPDYVVNGETPLPYLEEPTP